MKEEKLYQTWENSYNTYLRQLQHNGIDLDALLTIAKKLPQVVGHGVPGQVFKAGRIHELHPAPPS